MKTCVAGCGEVELHDDWEVEVYEMKYFRSDAPLKRHRDVAIDWGPEAGWQIWCGGAWADVDGIRARILLAAGPVAAQEWVNSRYTGKGAPR